MQPFILANCSMDPCLLKHPLYLYTLIWNFQQEVQRGEQTTYAASAYHFPNTMPLPQQHLAPLNPNHSSSPQNSKR